jgi:hypothetical protein
LGKLITSPASFKTCYIAEVKEEMGILKRKLKRERKIRAPQKYKRYIKMAIESLGEGASYKEIQQEAYRLYCQEMEEKKRSRIGKYFGVFKADKDLVDKVVLNKDIYYEI